MIKIVLRCDACDQQLGEEINITTGRPRWVTSLWNKAAKSGWVKAQENNGVYCPTCAAALESRPVDRRPAQSPQVVTLIECDGCGMQLLGKEAITEESFSRALRTHAAEDGWKFISLDEGTSYGDYCGSCALAARQSTRIRLMRLVWSKATQIAAWDMGVSDKAIENRCKRLEVPKPPRGFWAKWHAGHMDHCRTLIPEEVERILGSEFIDAIYPLDK